MNESNSIFNRFEKVNKDEVMNSTTHTENNYVVLITSISESTNESPKEVHCGNGVLVDNFLITAGHVAKTGIDHKFYFNNKVFKLNDLEEVFISTAKENNEYDLAIYRIPGINSPLTLSPVMPEVNSILTSKSFDYGKGNITCDATVIDIDGDCGLYYGVETSLSLKSGCSGSPLLFENQVYGIIVTGNNNGLDEKCSPEFHLNTCFVLSSYAMTEILNQFK